MCHLQSFGGRGRARPHGLPRPAGLFRKPAPRAGRRTPGARLRRERYWILEPPPPLVKLPSSTGVSGPRAGRPGGETARRGSRGSAGNYGRMPETPPPDHRGIRLLPGHGASRGVPRTLPLPAAGLDSPLNARSRTRPRPVRRRTRLGSGPAAGWHPVRFQSRPSHGGSRQGRFKSGNSVSLPVRTDFD